MPVGYTQRKGRSAAFLKKLRKKYRLGEYAPRGKGRGKTFKSSAEQDRYKEAFRRSIDRRMGALRGGGRSSKRTRSRAGRGSGYRPVKRNRRTNKPWRNPVWPFNVPSSGRRNS